MRGSTVISLLVLLLSCSCIFADGNEDETNRGGDYSSDSGRWVDPTALLGTVVSLAQVLDPKHYSVSIKKISLLYHLFD